MNGATISKSKVFFDLIRFPNILFIAYLQSTFFYLFVYDLSDQHNHPFLYLIYILFPTLCLTSFGNIVNDYYDINTDISNKKRPIGKNQISPDGIIKVLVIITAITVISILQASIGLRSLSYGIFLSIVLFVLYQYSSHLKCTPFLGNIIIASLSTLAVLLPLYLIQNIRLTISINVQAFILFFASFIFFFSLLRELIKDLQDYDGDKLQNCRTAAVMVGKEAMRKAIGFLLALMLISIIFWMIQTEFNLMLFIGIFVLTPFIIFILFFMKSNDFKKQSSLIKIQMFIASFILFAFKML